MRKSLIGIILLLVMVTTVSAYTLKDGKILLDNTDTAMIVGTYDGSTQNYLAHISSVERLAPQTGSLRLAVAQVGCTNCSCSATNPTEEIDVKGNVFATYKYKGFAVSVNFSDVCKKDLGFTGATGVLKVNCDNSFTCNFPKWTLYDCPNKDCHDGTCTKATIPEFGLIAGLFAVIGAIAIVTFRRK